MNVFSATERKETAENINVESLAKILIWVAMGVAGLWVHDLETTAFETGLTIVIPFIPLSSMASKSRAW